MEPNKEALMRYIANNSKFWSWEPDKWHYVVYLGYEISKFKEETGETTETIRYHFKLETGKALPIDVRSVTFAKLVSQFPVGSYLKVKRTRINATKYKYEVRLIDPN